MSNHFLYACSFDSSDLPFDLHQTSGFHHAVLDFNYKLMFGGDRRIYFVTENDEIITLRQPTTTSRGTQSNSTKVHLIPMNSPLKTKTLLLEADHLNFKSKYPRFHPTGYYRTLSDLYVVDMLNCDKVLRLEPDMKMFTFEHSKISTIISGPLGAAFLVQTKDKTLHNLKEGSTTVLNFNISFGCSFGGFSSSTPYSESTSPTLKRVDLEELADVIDVQAGYYHCIFLTSKGKVYVCGYDNMQQCSLGMISHSESFCPFTELKLDYGFATQIGGFSRGNYIINEKRQVYFIAEMFSSFSKKTHSLDFVQQFNLDDLNLECLNHDLKVNGNLNHIVATGWQCCISHNPNLQTEKTLKYMFKNLKVLSQQQDIGTNISDISIRVNNHTSSE
ncbi:hypothetical protein C9374_005047 [Naegleria lovaniensis]|uniref:Uncharacterized protein n=1 Tax=Naegleria lovaniensis TaxID=51637 RepID=A0AA88GQ66_NAELO|nr:uncharacterized protein C9374_005047 [Naegleria lovaniensis]KAG2382467.1 hypothetical protein C9374_005047 [Naegleria lovaniensis]